MAEEATETARQDKRLEILWGFGAVIAGLVVVIGILAVTIIRTGGEARLLATEGREAVADVLDRREVETRSVDNEGRVRYDWDHFATLRFDTPDRRGVEVETRITPARYEALQVGDRVTIRYAASDPRVVEFEPGEKAGEVALLRWAAIGLGVIAAGIGGLMLRQYRQAGRSAGGA
jgi:hypothetical protein